MMLRRIELFGHPDSDFEGGELLYLVEWSSRMRTRLTII